MNYEKKKKILKRERDILIIVENFIESNLKSMYLELYIEEVIYLQKKYPKIYFVNPSHNYIKNLSYFLLIKRK